MTKVTAINARDRDAVLTALRSGVVPRRGIHLVQVGRAGEIDALVKDLDRVAADGSAVRFVVGDFGAGKTFFLSLVRAIALEKRMVTFTADLHPDRRLHGSGGQARSLYAELTRNAATQTKPEGGALGSVVERFVTSALQEAKSAGMTVETVIHERLHQLTELVNGFDFAEVIAAYWRGHDQGNDQLKSDAMRWLRGEFSTKTDARNALGVRAIVDDDEIYDQLKLMARFVRLAGYRGLIVELDELVNLMKLPHTQARNSNYEQILRMFNDVVQGSAEGLGVIFGGTPETLMDTRRGLFSYPALQSRLSENTFARQLGVQDAGGPVIRLANLGPEDLYVLLTKLRHLQAGGDPEKYLVPDEAIAGYLDHCNVAIGAAYFNTPRQTIRGWLDFLNVLDQQRGQSWTDLIGHTTVERETNVDLLEPSDEEELTAAVPVPSPQNTAPPGSERSADDDLSGFRL